MSDFTYLQGAPIRHSRLVSASPVYYGWFVLGTAMLGMAMTVPGQTVGVSLFVDAIIADLGLSRSTVSLAYTFATVGGAFFLPFVGRAIDRFGPRRSVIVIASLLALACAGMGLVGGLASLFVGLLALRTLGQGSLSLVSIQSVNLWFVRRRGMAIGCMGLGFAAATILFPMIIEPVLSDLGWRRVYLLLGMVVAGIMLPAGALFFRDRPEAFGLVPDGRAVQPNDRAAQEVDVPLREARRTRAFWLVTAGGICISALGTGLMFHHFSIMEQYGISRGAAALVFLPLGLATAAANLGAGYVLDRFRPDYVLVAMTGLLATILICVPAVSSIQGVWIYGTAFGLAQGMQGTLVGSAYAYYFGRTHIGSIKGFAQTMFVGGAALGPFVYGVGFDVVGSYTPLLILTALAPLSVAVGAFVMRTKK